MTAPAKLAAFAVLLVALFIGGYLAGSVVGPIDTGGSPTHQNSPTHEMTS